MTKTQKAVGIGLAVVAGLAIAVVVQRKPHPVKSPSEAVREMTFPNGLRVTGRPDTGELCQEIELCSNTGCRPVYRMVHVGKDFRTATDEQKKAWLIEGAMKAVEEGGLACGGASEDPFFPSAYAQPHCIDCGGGCTSVSCPATENPNGNCTLGGIDCVITRICCTGVPCTCT